MSFAPVKISARCSLVVSKRSSYAKLSFLAKYFKVSIFQHPSIPVLLAAINTAPIWKFTGLFLSPLSVVDWDRESGSVKRP